MYSVLLLRTSGRHRWLGETLRWEFWYTVHDFHRLLFLAPVMWASYSLGSKVAVTTAVASLVAFLPRAIFISPYPDAMTRAVLDGTVIGIVGYVIPMMRGVVRCETDGAAGTLKRIEDGLFIVGDLEIDLSRRLTKRDGQIIKLTPKEYELLSYLVRNNGKMVRHEELLRNVWGSEYGQEREYLRNFVGQLRRKIEDDPSNPKLILTEPGAGYRFVEMNTPR